MDAVIGEPGQLAISSRGDIAVLERRKDDDLGWWLVGGAGLADRAIAMEGGWRLVGTDDLRTLWQTLDQRRP